MDVSADFFAGEIHAVVGENGAGKSTLMKVLCGIIEPDQGTVQSEGRPERLSSPLVARSLGIGIVQQHFMLVPAFTVAENLALDQLSQAGAAIDLERTSAAAQDWAQKFGWPLPLDARTESLPVGVQQRIEILKVLAGGSDVVILDEATAVLSPDEVEDLFHVLRQLRDEGRTIIVIAHKLSEITAIADRVTVLRRGEFVATARVRETSAQQIGEWMVGEWSEPPDRESRPVGDDVLTLTGVRAKGDRGEEVLRGINLCVRRGEIVGLGGVDGNGQVELAEVVAGLRECSSGTREVHGKVGYVPQDRQLDGLALDLSIADNLALGARDRADLAPRNWFRLKALWQWCESLIKQYQIKIGNPDDAARSLSGGNQQKIVVSRTLDAGPDLLVAVNPTRGLDFKATQFVHDTIVATAHRGAAVLLITTDRDELFALCDRTHFLSAGQLSDELLGSSA